MFILRALQATARYGDLVLAVDFTGSSTQLVALLTYAFIQNVYPGSNPHLPSPNAGHSGPFGFPVTQPPINNTFHDSLHDDYSAPGDATVVTLSAGASGAVALDS